MRCRACASARAASTSSRATSPTRARPGYHRQSLRVIDRLANSPSARTGGLERVFNQSLQAYYTAPGRRHRLRQRRARASSTGCRRSLGKPGDAGSLDTQFSKLRNALSATGDEPRRSTRPAPSMLSKAQSDGADAQPPDPRRAGPAPGDRDADRRPTSTTSTRCCRRSSRSTGG